MKRIGIITIHNSPNYGACLQSFALYEYIRQQGYDVEIIDLHRPFHSDYIKSKKFRPFEYRFESFGQKIKRYVKSIIRRRKKQAFNSKSIKNSGNDRQLLKFDRFNERIATSKAFRSIDELYACPPQYDTYLTGSDQVWNPTQAYCIEPYFLTFVKQGRKISYGSSIGIEKLTKQEKKLYKQWLSQYDSIAVREPSAQKLLENITGRTVKRVADPTFLLGRDYWLDLSKKPLEDNYILVFTLEPQPTIIEYAKKLAKESKKKLIVIGINQHESSEYTVVKDSTPEEWLGYIENASLVLTDSFHCTVFSIILQPENFYTYIAPWNERGSRIIDLLKHFSLIEHLLPVDLQAPYSLLSCNSIDYNKVNNIMESERELSRVYLQANI